MSNANYKWKQSESFPTLIHEKYLKKILREKGLKWERACIKLRCFCPQRVKNMVKEQWAGVSRECFWYSQVHPRAVILSCNSPN